MIIFFIQVLVIIDAKPKDLGLPTEAYVAVEEVHDVSRYFVITQNIMHRFAILTH